MIDPGLILAELKHRSVIDSSYAVPIRRVTLYEKTPKLNDGPLSVEKW